MLVMGILNVTPDSFADGGRYNTTEKAIKRGLEMITEGVDIIDIGGESTKPGAERVSVKEEQDRILPVITELAKHQIPISADTMRSETAALAVEAGATIINDVSGGLADRHMLRTVADLGCTYILMHWRGHSKEMDSLNTYADVVRDVMREIQGQVNEARKAGISEDKIIIDPGLGFAKDAAQNWEIVHRIAEFEALGFPILIGGSRKRFLGGDSPDEREVASIELTRSLLAKNIWGVRVHSVKPHREVILRNV
jgi:dihydropteroate synthase